MKGRSAREKGARAERDLVAWLRVNGWPEAARCRDSLEDRGDVSGLPGVCVQVKSYASPMRGLREGQAGALVQAHGRRPVAVVRLPRVTDPADWWAATPVERRGRGFDLGVDAREVGPVCQAATVHRAIASDGGALRWSHDREWWITSADRLFALLASGTVAVGGCHDWIHEDEARGRAEGWLA